MEAIGAFMVRHPWLVSVPLAGMAALAMAVGIYNYATAQNLDERVTVIEHSPCTLAPRGQECQTVFRDSIRAFNPRTVCVLSRKLDAPCPPAFRP